MASVSEIDCQNPVESTIIRQGVLYRYKLQFPPHIYGGAFGMGMGRDQSRRGER